MRVVVGLVIAAALRLARRRGRDTVDLSAYEPAEGSAVGYVGGPGARAGRGLPFPGGSPRAEPIQDR